MTKTTVILFAFLICQYTRAQTEVKTSIDRIKELVNSKNFENARQVADSLLLVTDPKVTPVSYLRGTSALIMVHVKSGLYTEAVKVGDELLTRHSELIGLENYATSEFYMSIGEAYHLTQSNNKKALAYFEQALRFYEELDAQDIDLKISILRGMGGTYYYMGQFQKSISVLQECQQILDNTNSTNRIAVNLRSIGNSYWGMRDYENAATSYERSLEVLLSESPPDSLTIGKVLHAKGYIHMDQEDFQKAYRTFALASELMGKKHPKVSSPMVWVYGDVGRSLIDLKKYDSALIWLQKALNANVFEFHQSDYYQNPPLTNINDDFQHFMILKLKGQAFLKKYIESGSRKDLEGMIDSYMQSDQQVDNIRRSIPKAEDQSTIAYYATELYSHAIDAMIEVNEINPEKRFLELGHYFMEKRKITQVHLKFLEASAKSSNILPSEMLVEDKEILDQIASIKSSLRNEMMNSSDSVSLLKKKLFDAQEKYEKFIAEVKRKHPSYHASRFNLKVASSSEVQDLLRTKFPNRAIVTYYNFGEKLRTSILTKDTLVIKVLRHNLDFTLLAQNFRERLTNPDMPVTRNDTLNRLLIDNISPLVEGLSEITFIPDPALQLIPMELMQYADKYLFENFDISYHFSSTLFISQNGQSDRDEFAGFAPSFDSLSLISLPGAEAEVKAISEIFEGPTFTGAQADESSFRTMSEKSGFIHLATHAIIDEENPESSYLQFSQNEGSNDDSRLYFFEIYNLNLNAQLVTLSACNTGFGRIQKGEGVMSLSRAFAYAGVPATVVSLWPASDKSTPELMKYFYQNLKDGHTKDVALNNARKSYLANAQSKARHPFYWGGFVLIGDNSPIEEETNLLVYVIPSALIIAMILTVYRRKKSRV